MLTIEISYLLAKDIIKSDVPITISELWERVEEATVSVTYNNPNLFFYFVECLFWKILQILIFSSTLISWAIFYYYSFRN